MADTWSGVWIGFENGVRLRKTEITAYEKWDATHSVIYLRNTNQQYLVHETVEDIDTMLDRETVSLSEEII